jgi:hypothetical protein
VAQKKKKKLSLIQKIQRFWRETVGELRKVTWPTPRSLEDDQAGIAGDGINGIHFGFVGFLIFTIDLIPSSSIDLIRIPGESQVR